MKALRVLFWSIVFAFAIGAPVFLGIMSIWEPDTLRTSHIHAGGCDCSPPE